MDFELSGDQLELIAAVDRAIEDCGGADRARAVSASGAYDAELDLQLARRVHLDGELLERILVVERLAAAGTATTFGTAAVLKDAVPLPDGPVAVLDSARSGIVRFGAEARTLVVLDGRSARLVDGDQAEFEPVRSSVAYPLVRLRAPVLGDAVDAGDLRMHRVALLTAEISGNATAAVAKVASYLRERHQFGRPLSTLQALRHRVAEAAVTVESISWLIRKAAFDRDARAVDVAAAYAARAASDLVPELVQLCGARSFMVDFGLQVFTTRLTALHLELGAGDRLADAVLAHDSVVLEPR